MTQLDNDEVKMRCSILDGEEVLWSSMAPDAEDVGRALWDAVRKHGVDGYERELRTEWVGELSMKTGVVVRDVDGYDGYSWLSACRW